MLVSRFQFECDLLARGVVRIAGVDEAGRGPLAGPVAAAAVQFPGAWFLNGLPPSLRGLNDSKRLSPHQREDYFAFLTSCADIKVAVALIDAPIIDTINILEATHRAMNEALAKLIPAPEHVLVDGLRVASLSFPQTAIVAGDSKSYSIAAASVIAKVTRDRIMIEHGRAYPQYGFAEHKGYATSRHLASLRELGPCPIHRRSFAPIRQPERRLTE